MDRVWVVKPGRAVSAWRSVDTMSTSPDPRWRGPEPQIPGSGIVLVTRDVAAEIGGVDRRTITRMAADGRLTKYRTQNGRIAFDAEQVARVLAKPDGAPASSVAELLRVLRGAQTPGPVSSRLADVQRDVPETEPAGIEPAWSEPSVPRPRRW